jgi:hypothetical protein
MVLSSVSATKQRCLKLHVICCFSLVKVLDMILYDLTFLHMQCWKGLQFYDDLLLYYSYCYMLHICVFFMRSFLCGFEFFHIVDVLVLYVISPAKFLHDALFASIITFLILFLLCCAFAIVFVF